jgi:hypothetical protein
MKDVVPFKKHNCSFITKILFFLLQMGVFFFLNKFWMVFCHFFFFKITSIKKSDNSCWMTILISKKVQKCHENHAMLH